MSSYATLLAFLDDLEAEARRSHERQIQQARLKPLLAKCHLLAQAGCPEMAAKYQHQAAQIMQRLQP